MMNVKGICPLCKPITGVMDNNAALKKLIDEQHQLCEEAARQSCLNWLSEMRFLSLCDLSVFPGAPRGLIITVDNYFPLDRGRVVRVPYRYIWGETSGEIAAEWPFQVLGSSTPLYMVLRQSVRHDIQATKRRKAFMDSPQWHQAQASFQETYDNLWAMCDHWDWTKGPRPMPEAQEIVGPDWDLNKTEFLLRAAYSSLQHVNLPTTPENIQALLSSGEGDTASFSAEVSVTSFFLFNPETPEFYLKR